LYTNIISDDQVPDMNRIESAAIYTGTHWLFSDLA